MIHIRPKRDTVAHLFPFAFVFPDAFFALLDKRLHAVFFNLFFAIQPQHFFHFQLHRQAVRVPAGFAKHVVSAHAFIARHKVFKAAGNQMADVRHAVGRRRAVKKAERRLVRLRGEGFFYDVVLLPKIQDLQFTAAKVHPGFYFLIHRLAFPFLCLKRQKIALWCFRKILRIKKRCSTPNGTESALLFAVPPELPFPPGKTPHFRLTRGHVRPFGSNRNLRGDVLSVNMRQLTPSCLALACFCGRCVPIIGVIF